MHWKSFFVFVGLCTLAAGPLVAQSDADYNMVGLTCDKILAMKEEAWEDYFIKKTGDGSEFGYDTAARIYAHCMKKRNDAALAKLPAAARKRINNLRSLCADFRVEALSLAQAYAGGGTMYTHQMQRGEVEDEQLTGTLIRIVQNSAAKPGSSGSAESKNTHLNRTLRTLNPALASNSRKLKEFSTQEQGASSYKKMKQDVDSILALLSSARPEEKRTILTFLDTNVNPLSG